MFRLWALTVLLTGCVLAKNTPQPPKTNGNAWMPETGGSSGGSSTGVSGTTGSTIGATTGSTTGTTTGSDTSSSTGTTTGTTTGATTGTPPSDVPPAGCTGLAHTPTTHFDSTPVHTYSWSDGACRPRSLTLSANVRGGVATSMMYTLANATTHTLSGGIGFGMVVAHLYETSLANGDSCSDSPLGPCPAASAAATYTTRFAGAHHAVHEFTYNYPRWGRKANGSVFRFAMPVVIHWVVATGRDHPLWAVTFDVAGSGAPAYDPSGSKGVHSDFRAPYGDIDIGSAGILGGVIWGDSHRLFHHDNPDGYSPNSGWDWRELNTSAPYVAQYRQVADSEMGLAGTRVYAKQPAGGYTRWQGQAELRTTADWDANDPAKEHDCATWNEQGDCHFPGHEWPYQSVEWSVGGQNDHPSDNKLTWGSDWGSLGKTSFTNGAGAAVVGYPQVSYAVFIVTDVHSANPTLAMAAEAEVVEGTTFSATIGTVKTSGPGPNPVHTVTYAPAGFNHLYATWDVSAAGNVAEVSFAVPASAPAYGSAGLRHPIVVVHDYSGSATPSLTWDGVPLVAGVDYFASRDPGANQLWVTLNHVVTGTHKIRIDP